MQSHIGTVVSLSLCQVCFSGSNCHALLGKPDKNKPYWRKPGSPKKGRQLYIWNNPLNTARKNSTGWWWNFKSVFYFHPPKLGWTWSNLTYKKTSRGVSTHHQLGDTLGYPQTTPWKNEGRKIIKNPLEKIRGLVQPPTGYSIASLWTIPMAMAPPCGIPKRQLFRKLSTLAVGVAVLGLSSEAGKGWRMNTQLLPIMKSCTICCFMKAGMTILTMWSRRAFCGVE